MRTINKLLNFKNIKALKSLLLDDAEKNYISFNKKKWKIENQLKIKTLKITL